MVLSYSDYYTIQQNGLISIERDGKYSTITSPFNETVEFVLDWDDLNSYVGKEIYQDAFSSITILSFHDDLNGGYKIYLDAKGFYNDRSGQLVTMLSRDDVVQDGFLLTTVGSNSYRSKTIYARGQSIYPNGDCIGYSIFPLECYEEGKLVVTDQIKANHGQITIRLDGLKKIIWRRV